MMIQFDKMEGAGNDFVMIDNRSRAIPDGAKVPLVKDYCRRAQGIGADGMIFIEPDQEYDFAWDFYNSDGSKAEMCGNGARCAASFAHKIGAAGGEMTFRTLAGPIQGVLTERGAKVQLTPVKLPTEILHIEVDGKDIPLWFLNSGVPHVVVRVDDIEGTEVVTLGRAIRHHTAFAPAGTNVNFFKPLNGNELVIRTYERGVEDETLACGTGSVATAIVASLFMEKSSPITVQTRSGEELLIHFTLANGMAEPVFLEGGARLVFSGSFDAPAW